MSVTVPNSRREEFGYDGLGRLRVSLIFEWNAATGTWNPPVEKRRVYDGMDVVQERSVENYVRASLTRTGNIGGILARSTAETGHTYFAYDERGNVTTLTDSAGAVVGSYAYDAWGNTVAQSGARAVDNPYRFSTKEALGGMYSFGYRFYNSSTGKWLNRDPIREAGGINFYAAMANDPINNADEYGLDWLGRNVFGPHEFDSGDGGGGGGPESSESYGGGEGGGGGSGGGVRFSGGRPSLKGDPYSPEAVEARIQAGRISRPPGWSQRDSWDDLPRNKNGQTIVCDPAAQGPHTVVGIRNNPRSTKIPYRTGVTFDKNGKPIGRIDVTNHFPMRGWQNHPIPHFHPWIGNGFVKGAHYPMP